MTADAEDQLIGAIGRLMMILENYRSTAAGGAQLMMPQISAFQQHSFSLSKIHDHSPVLTFSFVLFFIYGLSI